MTDLTTITNQLAEAQADLALSRRLASAEARVRQLTKDHAQAKAAQEKADVAEAKAANEALYAGVTAIRVEDTSRHDAEEALLKRNFTIVYTRESHDWRVGKCFPKEHVVHGFGIVPPEVLLYLIEKQPEQIPAAIMALAPGNPRAAIDEYFTARRRGYVIGSSAK